MTDTTTTIDNYFETSITSDMTDSDIISFFSSDNNFLFTDQTTIENDEPSNICITEFTDFGQNHSNWLRFMSLFPSSATYLKRMNEFFLWCFEENKSNSSSIVEYVELYFRTKSLEKKIDGTFRYARTAFRQWWSIFLCFFKFTGIITN